MAQEFFNQDLVSELDVDARLGGGIPGIVGCDNILVSNFLDQIAKYVTRSEGGVTLVSGSNDVDFSSDFGTTDYSLTVYDINGVGVQVISQSSTGFTIESFGSGVINYIATRNI